MLDISFSHVFNCEIAKFHGIESALILYYLSRNINFNEEIKDKSFIIDDKYWCDFSYEGLFSYLEDLVSEKAIRRSIEDLKNSGILEITGETNAPFLTVMKCSVNEDKLKESVMI